LLYGFNNDRDHNQNARAADSERLDAGKVAQDKGQNGDQRQK